MRRAEIPDAALSGTAPTARPASILRYSPAMVLLAIAIADGFRMADPDLWGHIRFGQMYLSSGHLLFADPFSYSAPGRHWLHHEWLAEAVMAWLYGHLGAPGLKLLKFTCSTGAIAFIAMGVGETGAPILTQLAILLLTALALTLGMQMRPQMFDFLAFSLVIWTLARDCFNRPEQSKTAPVLWLWIPLFALWSNLHGGFVMGLAAIAIYTVVTAAQEIFAAGGTARAAGLAAAAAAALLATFINPFALETWKTIIVTLRDPITAQVMADFRPLLSRVFHDFPDIGGIYASYGLALITAFVILFLVVRGAGDLAMVAVAALMSAAAFAATRNVSFAAIAIAPVLARRLAVLSARSPGPADGPAPRGWSAEAVPAVLAIGLMAMSGLFSPRLKDALPAPDGALAFMQTHGLSGNILNEFVWGEYLIWHCAPRCHVFIDGRFDLVYPIPVIEDYVHFTSGDDAAAHVLASYPHDFVLIVTESRAHRFMSGQPRWKLIYRDENAALFARAGSPASSIAPAPVIGHADASYFP